MNFIYITNEKNCKDDSDDSNDLQEPHNSDDDVTVDGHYYFYKKEEKNVNSNDLYDYLGMCDPMDVEPDDISEANYQSSLAFGIVEEKENNGNFPTTNAADDFFNLELNYMWWPKY